MKKILVSMLMLPIMPCLASYENENVKKESNVNEEAEKELNANEDTEKEINANEDTEKEINANEDIEKEINANEDAEKELNVSENCSGESKKTEYERLEIEHRAGILFEREQRRNKIVKITLPILFISLAFVFLLVNVIIPNAKYGKDYNEAISLMEEGKYVEAIAIFNVLNDYKDSAEKVLECTEGLYNKGISAIGSCNYQEAVSCFNALGEYKDSNDKLKEAKYGYINENKNNKDVTTYEYLKELKEEAYNDCISIYHKLYSWHISDMVVNTEENDYSTDLSYSFELRKREPSTFILKYPAVHLVPLLR